MGEREIRQLAQRCAKKGLRLKQAKALFDAMYIGDALAASGGSIVKAAAVAGVTRETMQRYCAKSGGEGQQDDS